MGELTLEKTLSTIRELFIDEAWKIRTAAAPIRNEVRACIERSRGPTRFKRAHELVDRALSDWHENLLKQTTNYFRTLFDVAIAHPEWISGDPVAWARSQVDALWTEELNEGHNNKRQWQAGKEERQRRGLPPTVGANPVRHLDWFRWVCDGPPDISRAPSDEPWRAPKWVMGQHWSCTRLSVDLTNYVLRRAHSSLEGRLEHELVQAERKVSIDLASRPTVVERESRPANNGENEKIGEKEFESVGLQKPARITSGRDKSRKRPGPKPKARNQVLREILSKQPHLPCAAVCRIMDTKYASDVLGFPTLARPEFGGKTYDSWRQAHSDRSARNLVECLISRCRPKSGPCAIE